ncbi:hypothetical protein Tco_1158951, partial [Tanacetum coccineum]
DNSRSNLRRQARDDALRKWEAQIDQLRRQEREVSEYKMVHTSKNDAYQKETNQIERMIRYFAFGRHLDELHVTWAHLEKKRTRLRTNTKTLEDLCSQGLETASQAIHDAVTTHQVMSSHHS